MPFCGRVVTGRRLLPVATRFMFSTIIMPMTKTTIVLLFLMSVWKGMFGGAHQIAQPKSEEVELQDYAPVGNTGGWVLLGQRLYVTDNSGTSWQDITPDGLAEARAHAILFADMRRGWVAIAKEDYTLAQTEDGGKTWRSAALPVSGDDASFAPASMQLSQTPDGALLLYIRRATSGAFRMGVWWLSADGGANWTRASEPPPLSPAGDAITTPKNLQKIKSAGRGTAWAKQVDGACVDGSCKTTTMLFATHDGGTTWQKMQLPVAGGLADGLLAEQTILIGQGFDVCDAPSLNDLQTWRNNGPYRAVNFYIGGAARGCANTLLNAAYLSRAAAMGWVFIPTWVGPQTPCSVFSKKFSSDVNVANAQGKAEAEQAASRAISLGLGSATTPTVIYYDLEAYPVSDANCRAAARAFMDGWTQRMRELKHIPGVYGAACGSAVAEFVGLAHIPQSVWLAYWTRSAYDPAITVWDVPCAGNDVWSNHQRLRQYTNSHDETWGGATLEIDSNVLDGPVSGSVFTPMPNKNLFLPILLRQGR